MTRSESIAVVKQIIENEGGLPGNSIHSWRCEYPERYGACNCVQLVAEMIIDALASPAQEDPA